MDATEVGGSRVEVQGGELTLTLGARRGGAVRVTSEPIVIGRSAGCDLVLDDRTVSAAHLEVVATERGVRVRDLGSRNGSFCDEQRFTEMFLLKAATLRLGDTTVAFAPSPRETIERPELAVFGPLVGSTPAMRALFALLMKASATDLTILIMGETGTGKEVVANAIHQASPRATKPFVVVDCSAIPASLAESVLFGHERGAFTGAVEKRPSPFLEADGGTVFLDELGELPIDVQPKLLRALAEQRIKSVGGSAYRPFTARVLAATRREMVRDVNAGSFRSDSYFRIAQVKVELPPLRERREDIPALVRRIADDANRGDGFARIVPESLERLQRYDWPGNVRELRNVVAVALAFTPEGPIDLAAHLSPMDARASVAASHVVDRLDRPFHDLKQQVVDAFEREYFTALFAKAGGNISEMARRAEVSRPTVRDCLRRLRIGGAD